MIYRTSVRSCFLESISWPKWPSWFVLKLQGFQWKYVMFRRLCLQQSRLQVRPVNKCPCFTIPCYVNPLARCFVNLCLLKCWHNSLFHIFIFSPFQHPIYDGKNPVLIHRNSILQNQDRFYTIPWYRHSTTTPSNSWDTELQISVILLKITQISNQNIAGPHLATNLVIILATNLLATNLTKQPLATKTILATNLLATNLLATILATILAKQPF